MSNYPPPQYGGGYGAHDQNNMPYLPPTYTPQYFQPDNTSSAQVQSGATSNYGAYGYNENVPTFNTATLATSVPPLPLFQGWNQDPPPLPSYSAPPPRNPYNGYGNTPQQQPSYYSPVNQTTYQPAPSHPSRPFDRSEQSEGEYDDGGANLNSYAIRYAAPDLNSNNGQSQTYSVPHLGYQGLEEPRIGAPNDMDVYNSPSQEYSQPARRGSDSYSPHISPVVSHALSRPNNVERGHGSQNGLSDPADNYSNGNLPHALSNHSESSIFGVAAKSPPSYANEEAWHAPKISSKEASAISTGRSVAEGRKRAQGAILNLWPYDVRFQTYISEGFREDIVGKLFDDLKMPRSSPTHPDTPKKAELSQQPTENPPNTNGNQAPLAPSSSILNSSIGPVKTQPISTPVEASKALNDKERTIQAKMEALKKSREERALKAAAQKDTKVLVSHVPVASNASKPTTQLKSNTHASESTAEVLVDVPSQQETVIANDTSGLPTLPQSLPQPPESNIAIPGLFLAAQLTSPSPLVGSASVSQANIRKRPVAADFDRSLSLPVPIKRPFGHNRNDQPLVIDVSEDEDDDVAMDLESEANQDSPAQSTRSLSDQLPVSSVVVTPQPALLPVKRVASIHTTGSNTPPIPSGSVKPAMVRPAELQRKESEIEELKRRIAKAEARNKAKQTPSRTQTPISNAMTPAVSSNLLSLPVSDVQVLSNDSSAPPQHQFTRKDSLSQPSTVESSDVPQLDDPNMDGLLRDEALAKQEIILRSNEVARYQKELQSMTAEIARIQVATEEARQQLKQAEAKEQQIQKEKELRFVRQNNIAIEKENLQRKEQDVVLEHQTRVATSAESQPAEEHGSPTSSPITTAHTSLDIEIASTSSEVLPILPVTEQFDTPDSRSVQDNQTAEADEPAPTETPVPQEQNVIEHVAIDHSVSEDPHIVNPANDSVPTDYDLEGDFQDAIRADAEADADIDTPSADEMKMEMEVDVSDLSEPGELHDEVSNEDAQDGSDGYVKSPTEGDDTLMLDEKDNYEPPGATPPTTSPRITPAQPSEVEAAEFAQDEIALVSDNGHQEYRHENRVEYQSLGHSVNNSQPEKSDEKSSPVFTPYESPLRRFKAYRFHTQFQDEVAGGLRSLTYSNKIDPNVELCRYESAGGICNDNTCEFLHYKDMGLPDDAILTALGSPEQFQGSRHDEFCNGLRALLMDLRVRKIRDFDVIASEILAYRAKFLDDNSKILPLEGVTV